MSGVRTFARNLSANWIGQGANLVVLFFMTPYILGVLGDQTYGLWSLLIILTGYMGIFDVGIRASTGRFVVLYIGKDDHQAVNDTIRNALGFYTILGLVVVAAGAGLGWVFPAVFSSVPADQQALLRELLPILALNVWLSAIGATFGSLLSAHDRFDLRQGVVLVNLAIRTAGTIAVLQAGWGLVGLTAVTVGTRALEAGANAIMARRVYPRLRVWPPRISRKRMRELMGFGTAAFLSSIAYRLINQTDEIVVGWLIAVEAVTLYSLGGRLVVYSYDLIQQIGTTVFPPIQRAAAREEYSAVRWLYIRQARLALMVGLPLYLGLIFFGRPFMILWVGADRVAAADVMAILAAAKAVYLFSFGLGPSLAALGHIRFNTVLALLEAGLNFGFSVLFVLAFGWGIWGVAGGTLAALVLVRTIAQPLYFCRQTSLSPLRYLSAVVWPGLITGAIVAGVYVLAHQVIAIDSWLAFFPTVIVSAILAVGLAGLLLLMPDDRRKLLARVRGRS